MKLSVHAIPHQSALWAASFPPGEAKGIVRIRSGFYKTVGAYRETPQSGPLGLPAQLCIKQLYAALWSATPAKPFRGAFGERIQPPLKGEEGRA